MKKAGFALAAACGAAVAVAAGKSAAAHFCALPLKERADRCSAVFVKAIRSFGNGLPEPDDTKEIANAANAGVEPYLDAPPVGAGWRLGYASASILPADFGRKPYCIAGNTRLPANYAVGVLDDIRVRAVALSDGSSRGGVVLAVVDCIGLSNRNVRLIRAGLSDFSKENGIASVNIASTHTHSSIDTMGIWGPIVSVFKNNRRVLKGAEGTLRNSCDEEYMCFLREKISETIREAVCDMTPGKLYRAQIGKNSVADASFDDAPDDVTQRGLLGFVWDRREPNDCSAQLLRLRFVPEDKTKKPTVLVSFGAHPYINSMKLEGKGNGDKISGDFVYSLCECIEQTGNNAIFVNGAVAAVYPTRLYSGRLSLSDQARAVGNETARIALAMTATNEEIAANPLLDAKTYEQTSGLFDSQDEKSLYRKWLEHKGSSVARESEVTPLLNLRVSKVPLQVDNPIFGLIAKLRVGDFTMKSDGKGNYTSYTEVGLLELGKGEVQAALIPGELEPAVLNGRGAVEAKDSFSGTPFSETPLAEAANNEDLLVFGLMNDAVGYIIPDNDFSMMFLGSSPKMKKLFGNHYLEIFSFGKDTAASLARAFREICESTAQSKAERMRG